MESLQNQNAIRRARPEDLEGLRELLRQVNQVHADGRPDLFVAGQRKYSDEDLLALMKDDTHPIFVSVSPVGQVLGHAFCIIESRPANHYQPAMKELYIDDICVDERHRQQHIATSLYQYIKDYARGIGCYHITLNVWELNAPAKAFYQSMGMDVLKTTMECIL